jgi:hypothetical protein
MAASVFSRSRVERASRQRAAQKLIAIELNRMLVQRCERLRDRETVVRGQSVNALVDDLVMIHGVEHTFASTNRKVS